jgi:hypothetical protein
MSKRAPELHNAIEAIAEGLANLVAEFKESGETREQILARLEAYVGSLKRVAEITG